MIELDKDIISARLKELRESNGFSQTQMAIKLDERIGDKICLKKLIPKSGKSVTTYDTGKQTVSQIERGTRSITFEIAFAYADIFGVSLDYILGHSKDWQKDNKDIKDIIYLSDPAISELKKEDGTTPFINILNHFISKKYLKALFADVFELETIHKHYSSEPLSKLNSDNQTDDLLKAIRHSENNEPELTMKLDKALDSLIHALGEKFKRLIVEYLDTQWAEVKPQWDAQMAEVRTEIQTEFDERIKEITTYKQGLELLTYYESRAAEMRAKRDDCLETQARLKEKNK